MKFLFLTIKTLRKLRNFRKVRRFRTPDPITKIKELGDLSRKERFRS